MNLSDLNTLPESEFVDSLRHVFEHSPWVIEAAAMDRPFISIKSLQASFEKILYGADLESQVALIQAHPDLAAKLEEIRELTDFSKDEQKRAGFAALSADELDEMRVELAAYRHRFGHPFILCVSEHPASDVLPILKVRSTASPDSERLACLFQIARIGWHRICTIIQ